MAIAMRPAAPEADYARIAALLSGESVDPITVDILRDEDIRRVPGKLLKRWAAADEERGVLGYGQVTRYPSQPPDLFHIINVVDAAWRGRGIGRMLYDHLLDYLAAYPVGRIMTEVRDDDTASQHFAQKRGFETAYHVFDSRLDVAAFDEARFAGRIEAVEAAGISFFTLAQAYQANEDAVRDAAHNAAHNAARHKLYAINRIAVLDEPGSEGTFPTYDNWRRLILDAPWHSPEGQFIAADGDQYVGLAGVYHEPGQPDMFNGLTGVERAYRGRGIALALKLLTIRYAKTHDARYITTGNDARNAPMLAINHKLGYEPLPGRYVMVKRIN